MDKVNVRGPLCNDQKPLWEATVAIVDWQDSVTDGKFTEGRTVRHLFLSQDALNVVGNPKLWLPGTMLALCRVMQVNVRVDQSGTFTWKQTADRVCHALLLVQAEPKDWKAGPGLKFPNCVCLDGTIDLNRLSPPAKPMLDLLKPVIGKELSGASRPSVNASGLLFEATFQFSWQNTVITAPVWMTPLRSAKSTGNSFYLTLDRELIAAEPVTWQAQRAALVSSFRELATVVRQKDEDEYWASLVLRSRTDIPNFFWSLSATGQSLDFPPGEWQIIVADQKPGQADVTPRSLLTLAPAIRISRKGATLTIQFKGERIATVDRSRQLKIFIDEQTREEKVKISGVTTEYETLAAADLLRQQYQLPTPDETRQATDPAVLWGCMPLADGWAQLPFLNLTETHYFDALPQTDKPQPETKDPAKPKRVDPLLTGAAIFGNDAPETYDFSKGEHPWSITLLDGKAYDGMWTVDTNTLSRWELTIFEPDLVLNGFLQLGIQTPGETDLLPSLDNFLGDLRPISLRTVQPDDAFPSPYQLHFTTINFKNTPKKDARNGRKFSVPTLQNWQFSYQLNNVEEIQTVETKKLETQLLENKQINTVEISTTVGEQVSTVQTSEQTKITKSVVTGTKLLSNEVRHESETLLKKLLKQGIWSRLSDELKIKKFTELVGCTPLVWRRHPTAPLIQALPLTQTRLQPSYPSPSRQLAPFQLAVSDNGELSDADFGSAAETGAKDWVSWLSINPAPAKDWQQAGLSSPIDANHTGLLPLASLGIPGLIFDPNSSVGLLRKPDGEAANDFLPIQLRYSLPYADELYALAQLPKTAESNPTTGGPERPPEKPILVPRREFYRRYWHQLAEKAALAKVDADSVLSQDQQGVSVTHLIEPFSWEVDAEIDLTNYPGSLMLTNRPDAASIPNQLILTGSKSAEEPKPEEPFIHKVSSLQGITGSFELNSRQLRLRPTAVDHFKVIAGSMSAHGNGTALRDQRGRQRGASVAEGTLLKTPFEQQIDGQSGQFILCTLLAAETLHLEDGQSGNWQFWFRDLPVDQSNSGFSRNVGLSKQHQDVNDPLADTAGFNALSGYEWRLNDTGGSVRLLGFDFFPLTLETVDLGDDKIEAIELIGRLQLPESMSAELPELGNAIRVIFHRENDRLQLRNVTSVLVEGETTTDEIIGIWPLAPVTNSFAPRLHWKHVGYEAKTHKFDLESHLEFFLLGTRWSTLSKSHTITPGEANTLTFELNAGAILFDKVTVELDENLSVTSVVATLRFGWGNPDERTTLGATADVTLNLLEPHSPDQTLILTDHQLTVTLKTSTENLRLVAKGSLSNQALQLEFSLAAESTNGLALLPGMILASDPPGSGFAVLSFSIETDNATGAWLRPKHGSLEAVFLSEWGESLAVGATSRQAVFGSSAGHVCAGYTMTNPDIAGNPNGWQSSLLLNGMVDVNNLISYPEAVRTAEPPLELATVRFDLNSAKVSVDDQASLKSIADQLSKYNNVQLRIEGHADNSGQEKPNLKLSANRADSTRAALGTNPFTIVTQGFGETLLLDDTPAGQAKNRRTTVYLLALPDELRTFEFTIDSDQSGSEAKGLLDDLAKLLEGNPAIRLRLEGHANDREIPAENRDLSRRRAEGIQAALVARGLSTDRVTTLGFGQAHPVSNQPQDAPNRRVDIRLFHRDPGTIIFDSSSSDLTEDARIRLKRFADIVSANPTLKISVEGHSDDDQSAVDNASLAKKRAEAVKNRLIALQLPSLRITTAGFGETLPVADNQTPVGQAKNRRVELHPMFVALPAVGPDAPATAFNHVRHRLRILLNQHEVPAAALSGGKRNLLFTFKDKAAWQFLAVAEHQLIDVAFGADLDHPIVRNDRRWTVVQEIRLVAPGAFADHLNQFVPQPGKPSVTTTFPAYTGTDPRELRRVSSAIYAKPFLAELLKPVSGGHALTQLGDALLVEASVVQQLLRLPTRSDELSNLQYLTGGVQQAILSIPGDYAMPVVDAEGIAADWSLLALPFLGRMQRADNDGIAEDPASKSPLAVDPILSLFRQRQSPAALPLIPLALASRGDKKEVPVTISRFDLSRFRRFRRLDPTTLLESWFRLQNPPTENQEDVKDGPLVSVTAALPADSPSRLSRSALLKRLFYEGRDGFPPTVGEGLTDDPSPDAPLSWRRNTLLTWQGLSDLVVRIIEQDDKRPYSFYFAAAQIHSFDFLGPADQTNRFPAVTLLPAPLTVDGRANDRPVSFAVSPYLGLGFETLNRAQTSERPVLAFAELLCLDQKGRNLTSIASRVWEENEPGLDPAVRENWATELKNRLAADSPLAVLRVREVFRVSTPNLARFPNIRYTFQVLTSVTNPALGLAGASPLRQPLQILRFAEGQFRPGSIPETSLLFEHAPPQVTGVQPLYHSLRTSDRGRNGGLSALRVTVSHTQDNTGVVGEANGRVWWQAFAHQVQFAHPPEISPLLPIGFRARSIPGLLPVIPKLPLPAEPPGGAAAATIRNEQAWQPILPGNLAYLLVGARAGASFALWNRIMRQDDRRPGLPTLTAGGFPVQHRIPRPVELPENPKNPADPAPIDALRTWASYFDPQLSLMNSNSSPFDHAFVVDSNNQAHGLNATLLKPEGSIMETNHDGVFQLEIIGKPTLEEANKWSFQAELVTPVRALKLEISNGISAAGFLQAKGSVNEIRALLSNLPHGAGLQLRLTAVPPPDLGIENSYGQTLVFPLRLAQINVLRNPFQYQFFQFEDPEYNHRLTSPAAQSVREVTYLEGDQPKKLEITLATDRREYNPSSEGVVAVLSSETTSTISGDLHFKWIKAAGTFGSLDKPNIQSIHKFSLLDLQEQSAEPFAHGDSLLITLDNIRRNGIVLASVTPMEVRVAIVAEPVTPVPTAAYALLRRHQTQSTVECVRFAWSPSPDRIELITPQDLKSGLVRRRAVFRWIDVVRFGHNDHYSLQKITSAGSTAFETSFVVIDSDI